MAAGTTYGKKLTIGYKDTPAEVYDDIRRQSFTIQYTAGACTMTIVNSSAAKTLATSAGGIAIDLNNYPTVGDIATYINDQTGFTCAVIAGQEEASSLELDAVTAQDINAGVYTAQSTFQAIIDTVNSNSARMTAEASNAAENRVIPQNLSLTYVTGAGEGAYTSTEWTAALTALEGENIQFVTTPDSSASVHAAIKAHCEAMCTVTGRRERQFIVG